MKHPGDSIDESTFLKLQRGDERAFKLVYEAYVGYVQYLCRLYFRSTNEQDDVIQEVFMKLYEKASTIEDHAKLKGWIGVVSRNTILDHLRRQGRNREDMIAEPAEGDLLAGERAARMGSEPQASLDVLILKDLIKTIVAEPDGEVFLQFYQEGLSLKEISEQTGDPVGTITSRLTRLRKKFQKQLEAYLTN